MIVKICGITNVDDARFALDAGANWIGLNLVAGPRRIDLVAAERIIAGLDDASRAVVLLRAEHGRVPEEPLTTLRRQGVHRFQLYNGGEGDAIAQLLREGIEGIAVVHVGGEASLSRLDEVSKGFGAIRPAYVLLDSGGPGQLGGTGRRADWSSIQRARREGRLTGWPPIILAGGLTPENVGDAIRAVHPAGVDVSSGIESSPGRKDRGKVQAFIEAARSDGS